MSPERPTLGNEWYSTAVTSKDVDLAEGIVTKYQLERPTDLHGLRVIELILMALDKIPMERKPMVAVGVSVTPTRPTRRVK